MHNRLYFASNSWQFLGIFPQYPKKQELCTQITSGQNSGEKEGHLLPGNHGWVRLRVTTSHHQF